MDLAMYLYDEYDRTLVRERAAQFRDQVERRVSGELSEAAFTPLRLMNGVYLQRHAYMLRVAIPYGVLSSDQLRKLAHIARTYDQGIGHFTTRQNIQFNWPELEDVPDILDELAHVDMHAIQTSGNCIRNVTADPFAGVAADEIDDPRIWAEIIRQWSTLHPEFSFLPRKFKVAVNGAAEDRAAIRFHDIGLQLRRSGQGEIGFEVFVGGGQGRSPRIGRTVKRFLPAADLLSYLDAVLRIYNQFGRRDNKYKARIKILVDDLGTARFRELVEAEWQDAQGTANLPEAEVARIRAFFAPPSYGPEPVGERSDDLEFNAWADANLAEHRVPGYAIATVSLKPIGGVPGDLTDAQMDAMADLADRYSRGEIRATHEQNLILPHVKSIDLFDLWSALALLGLGTGNSGQVTDIIACPGLDFCSLANAPSISVAQEISERFGAPERAREIGPLSIKVSGCINACGHHHVGDIGILGVDKKGAPHYQITLGGVPGNEAAIGRIVGPAVPADKIGDAVERLVSRYLSLRAEGEHFAQTFQRVGLESFKEELYVTG
jgi:sulfite reductase (NADPH) hemoprotein beta-component